SEVVQVRELNCARLLPQVDFHFPARHPAVPGSFPHTAHRRFLAAGTQGCGNCEHCKDDHACRRVFHGIGLLSLLHCDCEWALNCSANGWCTLLVTCFHGLDRRCRLLLQNEAALTMREARLFVSVISIWPGCGCFMVSCGWLSTNFKAGQPHHEFLQP